MVDRSTDLADLGRALSWDEPAPERVEQVRTALLASAPQLRESDSTPKPKRLRWMALLAAAAALVVGVSWPKGAEPGAPAVAATVHPSVGAQFTRVGTPTNRIVRLSEGSLVVEVQHLASGQRFRVITGDAEVEVRGTAFDVVAEHDRLRSVRVLHGRVEVRRTNHEALLLGAGQVWRSAAEPKRADPAPQKISGGSAPASVGAPRRARAAPTNQGQSFAKPEPSLPAPSSSAAKEQADEAAFREGYDALRAGNPKRAEAAFARAARSAELAEDAAFWRAVSLTRSHRREAATRAFQEFLSRYPSSPRRGEASAMLGKLLLESGDSSAARAHFEDAAKDPRPEVRHAAEQGLDKNRR